MKTLPTYPHILLVGHPDGGDDVLATYMDMTPQQAADAYVKAMIEDGEASGEPIRASEVYITAIITSDAPMSVFTREV